ncbi:MAG: hypothetical protein ABJA82_08015 [Myxococcales bacterium]
MRLSFCALFVTFVPAFAVPRLAHALDCPCTWEEVVCKADAVAEVEMSLATKTSPDHVTIRRVIWNGTKHRVKTGHGESDFRDLTPTRAKLQWNVKEEPRVREPGRPESFTMPLYRQALSAGSYRTMLFLRYDSIFGWYGAGLIFNGVEWLTHPLHAEWWERLQPLLAERIRLYGEGKKPAACNVTRDTTRFAKFDLYGYDTALELTGDKRVIR